MKAWKTGSVLLLSLALSVVPGFAGSPASARLNCPTGPTIFTNVTYETVHGVREQLDIYEPLAPLGRYPAVVLIHGGGWSAGDKSEFCAEALALSSQDGFVAVSVDYRLAPKNPYPAATQDVAAAVKFLRANAAMYHIDVGHIGAFGASAGGHLAAILGTAGKGSQTVGARVGAVVSWSGPMDLAALWNQNPEVDPTLQDFMGCDPATCASTYSKASPTGYVDATDSPMLIANSTEETIPLAQATEMDGKLVAAAVPQILIEVPGSKHATAYECSVWQQSVNFLEQYLGAAMTSNDSCPLPNPPG